MAKPIRSLELLYPMTQFLIIIIICLEKPSRRLTRDVVHCTQRLHFLLKAELFKKKNGAETMTFSCK